MARSIRLVFEFEGDEIRLLSRTSLGQPAPPGDSLGPVDERHGEWLELRTADGTAVYEQAMAPSARSGVEVFAPDGVHRETVAVPRGVFVVVVPDDGRAVEAVLRSTVTAGADAGAKARQAAGGAVRDLARVDLRGGDRGRW